MDFVSLLAVNSVSCDVESSLYDPIDIVNVLFQLQVLSHFEVPFSFRRWLRPFFYGDSIVLVVSVVLTSPVSEPLLPLCRIWSVVDDSDALRSTLDILTR